MNYYISDLHLFQEKHLVRNSRPFHDTEEMWYAIKKNWEEKVTRHDTVYIVGDVCDLAHADIVGRMIRKLPGEKILIHGNHDMKNIKDRNFMLPYKKHSSYMEIVDNGRNVVLCHYPIEEWDGYWRGYYHIHGHVHGREDIQKIPRRYNASVDVTEYGPVTLDWLIEKNKENGAGWEWDNTWIDASIEPIAAGSSLKERICS